MWDLYLSLGLLFIIVFWVIVVGIFINQPKNDRILNDTDYEDEK